MENKYQNILAAIGQKQADNALSASERVENYNLLEKLNSQGIKLSDILKQAENTQKIEDADIFRIMESEVRNDPTVKDARDRLTEVKTEIIVKMCSQYPEYRTAAETYRRTVRETYMKKRGNPECEASAQGPSVSGISSQMEDDPDHR
jgi:hypothetical protein